MTDPKQAKCLDPNWRYVSKEATDIRKTFARIRREMKASKPSDNHVVPMRKSAGGK